MLFIITALHPHRSGPMVREEIESMEEETVPKQTTARKKQLDVLSAIIPVIEEQEAYFDPHLTIQDVANRCGYSRSTLQEALLESGFNTRQAYYSVKSELA